MPNANVTKRAIADSFKKLMETTPFDRISVSSITDGCHLNRQTFYYHFQDKYELINWIFYTDVIHKVSKDMSFEHWETGICKLFSLMKEDKRFYANAIRYTNSEFNRYIFKVMTEGYDEVIDNMKQTLKRDIQIEDREFLAAMFGYGATGIITHWIETGMKEAPEVMTQRLSNAVHNFGKVAVLHYYGNINGQV